MQLTRIEIEKAVEQASQGKKTLGICSYSGMAFQFPGLPKPENGKVLVVKSPLAEWHNVQGYATHGRDWLEKQSNSFLAGLLVAGYNHWDLLDIGPEATTAEANRILSMASQPLLITLVSWMRYYDKRKTAGLPVLVIDWAEVRQEKFNCNTLLQAYTERLRPYFDQAYKEKQRVEEIRKTQTANVMDSALQRMGRQLAGGQYLSAKQTYAQHEREFEVTLKAAKNLIKDEVKQGMSWASEGLRNMLTTLSQGRNLVAVNGELRKQLIERLTSLGKADLAKALQDTNNPYDIFVRGEAELDRLSDEWREPVICHPNSATPANKTPTSIKEYLAMRKAQAENPVLNDEIAENPNTPSDF